MLRIMLILLVLTGCATSAVHHCPPFDAIILLEFEGLPTPIYTEVPKGYFDMINGKCVPAEDFYEELEKRLLEEMKGEGL